ncbi:MAG: NIF family HAD-type phosphatase [Zavarzinella sp.]
MSRPAKIKVLALDLERTLIDNAMSGQPRPGLDEFLHFCHQQFERVAIFSTVEEADARSVISDLKMVGQVPSELFDRLEFINWVGEFKDLSFVIDADPQEVLLIDDDEGWIRPDQRSLWLPIKAWDGGDDFELKQVQKKLESLLANR